MRGKACRACPDSKPIPRRKHRPLTHEETCASQRGTRTSWRAAKRDRTTKACAPEKAKYKLDRPQLARRRVLGLPVPLRKQIACGPGLNGFSTAGLNQSLFRHSQLRFRESRTDQLQRVSGKDWCLKDLGRLKREVPRNSTPAYSASQFLRLTQRCHQRTEHEAAILSASPPPSARNPHVRSAAKS